MQNGNTKNDFTEGMCARGGVGRMGGGSDLRNFWNEESLY